MLKHKPNAALTLMLLGIFAATSCNAGEEDGGHEPAKWSLGVVGIVATSPYKSYDNTVLSFPLVS